MPARCSLVILFIVVLALATPRSAAAVCQASEIIGSPLELGCPAAGTACVINRDYVVDNGCTFDFAQRTVTVNGHWTVGPRAMLLRAQRLILGSAAFLDGIGSAQAARGGLIQLVATGTGANGSIAMADNSRIDAGGNLIGGDISLIAGGPVTISGRIRSDFRNQGAAGGTIEIDAGDDLTVTALAILSARGGVDSDGGGEIDLSANGRIEVNNQLLVDGYDGGFIDIEAGTTARVLAIDASGGGDAGSGGCVEIYGSAGAELVGLINTDGIGGTFMTGGCGGLVQIDGDSGDVVIDNGAKITATGGPPDGGGGQIILTSLRSAVVNGVLEARGPDGESCGGDVCVEGGVDMMLSVTGKIDASGGDAGGCVDIVGLRHVTLSGQLLADGNRAGAYGGGISASAGGGGYGNLVISNLVDATSAPRCSFEAGCGLGGLTDFSGCNVTVDSGAQLLTGGPEAGENNLSARELLTIKGKLDSVGTTNMPVDGQNRLLYPARKPAVLTGSVIAPAALTLPLTTCPNEANTVPHCLMPCPTCGNGVTEFPETCDPGLMPPLSCQANGCSVFCQLENCNDGMTCTTDTCDPAFGCRHSFIPMCTEPPIPTATVTGTPPTATATASASATPTATPTVSTTPTLSATPTPSASSTTTPSASATLTASATASPSATPTASATSTAPATASSTASSTATASPSTTASATASQTPSATITATATATATQTGTSSPTALDTPTDTPVAVSCAGDCNGDGSVAVNELIVGVNVALGNAPASSCAAFDRNGDGTVTIAELIAAVNAALNGC